MDENKQERNLKTLEQRLIQIEEWLALITNQKFPGTQDLEGFKSKLAELEAFRNHTGSSQ